ncbi:MAG: CYTH domain-containing protein [Pseudomonadota bacterium]
MPKEIERKFLIDLNLVVLPANGEVIKQGYIQTISKTVVRVRRYGQKAFLTLKGENSGASRSEFEYEIPVAEAETILIELCQKPFIAKTRYCINVGKHIWEIDVFSGENEGLILAEIELSSETEAFEIPNWASKEVTDDSRYYNSNLVNFPYQSWAKV